MKRKLIITLLGIGSVFVLTFIIMLVVSVRSARPMYSEILDPDNPASCRIFDQDTALTFARFMQEEQPQLLLVTGYSDGSVNGINLSKLDPEAISDPIDYFRKYGYSGIQELGRNYTGEMTVVDDRELILPARFADDNIAVGLNYSSHAEEVNEDEPPFLYPKKVAPSLFNSIINVDDFILPDYELELGFVFLDDITRDSPRIDYLGFMLVHDFTDRKPIVQKHVDVLFGRIEEKPDGIQGYPVAKNKEGAFPVGNLFVIPRDYDVFLETSRLQLYLNNDLRQVADTSDLIWGPERVVEEIFNRSEWVFEADGAEWNLLADNRVIPSGTVILSGTPHGILFKKANMWNPMVFLKDGDRILMTGEGLGFIANTIAE